MSPTRPYNSFRALRPEYIEACDGNAAAALLLDLFAYWTQVRTSNDEQSRAGGGEGNDLWFYRSLADLHSDLYGAFGRAAIRTALQVLTDKGLIESRCNPAKPWDRTLQYRTLHDAKSDDVHGAESNDDVRARPSQPSAARSETEEENQESSARQAEVDVVFEAWRLATGRPEGRTKLTGERRTTIKRALASHGLEDCLAAVRGIGASAEARTGYGRGTRFDDVKHALSNAERIERWRDWKPPLSVAGTVHPIGARNRNPTGGELLRELAEAGEQARVALGDGGLR